MGGIRHWAGLCPIREARKRTKAKLCMHYFKGMNLPPEKGKFPILLTQVLGYSSEVKVLILEAQRPLPGVAGSLGVGGGDGRTWQNERMISQPILEASV